jgi:hypothetical protein
MRLVLISDTHGLHGRVPQLPQGDILVHAGDFMNAGYDLREVVSFNRWLGDLLLRLNAYFFSPEMSSGSSAPGLRW